MCRDRELLDFEVDSVTGTVESVRVLDESCLAQGVEAPSFVGGGTEPGSLVSDVERMLFRRSISPRREDLPELLNATGAQNSTELALRSRGCSLSDQYWYRPRGSHERWADVNFFENDWDPTFGNAVLSRDWKALARASVDTPDVTCSGWTRKAWIREEGTARLLKASRSNAVAFLESEIIVTRMLSHILKPEQFTHYEKVHRFDEDFVACNLMLGPTEEHVAADALLGAQGKQRFNGSIAQKPEVLSCFAQTLDDLGVKDTSRSIARISIASVLILSKDMNLFNFGAIRNVENGEYRAEPLYDYGGSFGLSLSLKQMETLCAHPVLASFFVNWILNDFAPGWDYSWYDPQALQGFDEELEDALLAIDGLPAGFSSIIREAFSAQLDHVNEMLRS